MCRPSVGKFPSWKGHGSPNGAEAVADPVTLLTSEGKASSGFDVGVKGEGLDGRKRDSVTGEIAAGSGYLGDFVDQVGSGLAGGTLEDPRRSRDSSRERSGERLTRSQDNSPAHFKKDGRVNSSKEKVRSTAAEGSPVEVGYLEDYSDGGFTKPEVNASPSLSNEQEDAVGAVQRQSSAFEDTLSPWKADRVKLTTVPDGDDARDQVPVLSLGMVLSDDGVRDSGMGTASDARCYGEWSDEEGAGFGQLRGLEEGLGQQDERGFGERETRRRAGGRWGREYEDLSDEDVAKSPYDFDYEEPGT